MAKVPKPRSGGQRGGGGYSSHGPSMGRSTSRGGRPHAGGGGGSKNGCAVAAIGLAGATLAAFGATAYGLVELARTIF